MKFPVEALLRRPVSRVAGTHRAFNLVPPLFTFLHATLSNILSLLCDSEHERGECSIAWHRERIGIRGIEACETAHWRLRWRFLTIRNSLVTPRTGIHREILGCKKKKKKDGEKQSLSRARVHVSRGSREINCGILKPPRALDTLDISLVMRLQITQVCAAFFCCVTRERWKCTFPHFRGIIRESVECEALRSID